MIWTPMHTIGKNDSLIIGSPSTRARRSANNDTKKIALPAFVWVGKRLFLAPIAARGVAQWVAVDYVANVI
jgi:hypothetical protein